MKQLVTMFRTQPYAADRQYLGTRAARSKVLPCFRSHIVSRRAKDTADQRAVQAPRVRHAVLVRT